MIKFILYLLSFFYDQCLYCEHWRFIRDEDCNINPEITWPGPHGECYKIDDISQDCGAWVSSTCEKTRCERNVSDCEGSLITKPNFGCNLFKRRNKKKNVR